MTSLQPTQLLNTEERINQAVALLKAGECVALPTETVYGLAADASNSDAVAKIFAAKGRPTNHPLIVHIPELSHVHYWAKNVNKAAITLAEAFWPGPLTLILNAKDNLNSPVTGGLNSIGLRVPAHPQFLAVLKQLNTGLAAPSANRYKQLSPINTAHVMRDLNGRISAVLEGGQCDVGIESTIVDATTEQLRILRPGPISAADILQKTGLNVTTPLSHNEAVPGNVKAHYQPHAPAILINSADFPSVLSKTPHLQTHYLIYSTKAEQQLLANHISPQYITKLSACPVEYAKNMYKTLHHIDETTPMNIYIEKPPVSSEWGAVNDRLSRATTVFAG
ncbi:MULTISPECIES: L-threonylcarbamoyladenylate synthase [unclassified Pseudoalteromonas]|uniref:L-threonylcarbamoyladenylate synthase n=1 Tax=unclassified Pseudoalteromonas TaxID=194690 RepID=UPI00048EFE07|nr:MULTISPECIES: L-threonylcarbamoyladenylate synthase [unclassified Pseudoalteromonas]